VDFHKCVTLLSLMVLPFMLSCSSTPKPAKDAYDKAVENVKYMEHRAESYSDAYKAYNEADAYLYTILSGHPDSYLAEQIRSGEKLIYRYSIDRFEALETYYKGMSNAESDPLSCVGSRMDEMREEGEGGFLNASYIDVVVAQYIKAGEFRKAIEYADKLDSGSPIMEFEAISKNISKSDAGSELKNEAFELFRNAIEDGAKESQKPLYYMNLASHYIAAREYSKASELLYIVDEFITKNRNEFFEKSSSMARKLKRLGVLLHKAQDESKAASLLLKAEHFIRKMDSERLRNQEFGDLARIYYDIGQSEKAREHLAEALKRLYL